MKAKCLAKELLKNPDFDVEFENFDYIGNSKGEINVQLGRAEE